MDETPYPLQWPEGWPATPAEEKKRYSAFQTTFGKARDELLNELRLMGAENVVISSWLPRNKDGSLRADAARRRVDDPGIAVYFTLNGKRMAMARDAYETVHDNLRSVGLAIAALRIMERHGGGHMLTTAMQGFTALGSDDHWWTTLEVERSATLEEVRAAWRQKMKETHPDVGGSDHMAARINDAWTRAQEEKAA